MHKYVCKYIANCANEINLEMLLHHDWYNHSQFWKKKHGVI